MIKFSLDADFSSLFTWNTKQLFVYVTAEWPAATAPNDSAGDYNTNQTNKAVIWDTIITSPSSDHLANIGPATLKKLRKSAAGKTVDPNRYENKLPLFRPFFFSSVLSYISACLLHLSPEYK